HRQRHPGIEIHLVEDGGARLPNRLERGDIHLAIMPASYETFRGRLLYPMHLLAVVPSAHPIGKRAKLEIGELADEPLLMMGPGHASLNWFEGACHLAHIKPRVIFQSGNLHTLIELAKANYGVSIVPSPVRIPRDSARAVPLVYRGAS